VNAVERVLVYSDLPPEGHAVTARDPPENWPDRGSIIFTDVEMAYRTGLPLVLKSVNFDIKPGEKVRPTSIAFDIYLMLCFKVGVVGRTGAGSYSTEQRRLKFILMSNPTGKSSLLQALFRWAPCHPPIRSYSF
jgi:ATP-binding cassette, subfamily C (CFTR/MRP), member 1